MIWNFDMKIIIHFRPVILWIVLILPLFSCESNTSNSLSEKIYAAGVYSGGGASTVCVTETMESMKLDRDFTVTSISPSDIQNGKLDSLDVLIFPGGSGSMEYLSLGQSGAERVKEFIQQKGKGLVGICAGGYLFATTEGYPSLELLRVSTYRDHYDRGRGLIAFDLNEKGKLIFPELADFDTLYLQYYDGPIYRLNSHNPPVVLGTIQSDIATSEDDPKGLTPGKPSFLYSTYGDGRIMVTTGHPESTPGMRWMVPRMARHVLGAPLIAYDTEVVRPEINQKEILYYPDLVRLERSCRWGLYSDKDSIVLASLEQLHALRSRPSIRWSTGLLRHNSPEVRVAAARYLLETEYTDAIPDLVSASRDEEDREVLHVIEESLSGLTQIIR
ncbi:MAG: BPL-N domain-containing protein [Bacteroidota bacterium]